MPVLSTDINQIKSEVSNTLVGSREYWSGVLQVQLLDFPRATTSSNKPLRPLWYYRWLFNLMLQQLLNTDFDHLCSAYYPSLLWIHLIRVMIVRSWITSGFNMDINWKIIWVSIIFVKMIVANFACFCRGIVLMHIKTWRSDLCFNSNNHEILRVMTERVDRCLSWLRLSAI